MADSAPTNTWPELDGRIADVALNVWWVRDSTNRTFQLTFSSSEATHYSGLLGDVWGIQSTANASRMILKGTDYLQHLELSTAGSTAWTAAP